MSKTGGLPRWVPVAMSLPVYAGSAQFSAVGVLLGARLVTDGSVAFALAQRDPARRRAAFWISGLGLFAAWNAGALIGALGDTATYGLDAAFPAVLVALAPPALRTDRSVRRSARRWPSQ